MTTPSHIELLAALRQWRPDYLAHFTPQERRGFRLAVGEICRVIESRGAPDSLWSSPTFYTCPEKSTRIGDHIAATRVAFGILP